MSTTELRWKIDDALPDIRAEFQKHVAIADELTRGERDELRRLVRERQATYGSGRARVQNSLTRKRLAGFVDSWCEITELGRSVVAALPVVWSRR